MLDLEDEVLDNVHCHFPSTVDQQAQSAEVRVPVVELRWNIVSRDCYKLNGERTSLNRAPGTMNGTPSKTVLPVKAEVFFFMARARMPGLSFSDLTKTGSSGQGGSTSTSRPSCGFAFEL